MIAHADGELRGVEVFHQGDDVLAGQSREVLERGRRGLPVPRERRRVVLPEPVERIAVEVELLGDLHELPAGFDFAYDYELLHHFLPEEEINKDEAGEKARKKDASAGSVGVSLTGIDDIMVRYAKCCDPIPGDEIVGYIHAQNPMVSVASDMIPETVAAEQ